MEYQQSPGSFTASGFWLDDAGHRAWLVTEATRQLSAFSCSNRDGPGFHVLDIDGGALPDDKQELITTTRLVHSYALARCGGYEGGNHIIDQGMSYLKTHHKDPVHGGYVWALRGTDICDDRKLAYGHAFVLLAAASAKMADHPDADALLADVDAVLDIPWNERKHAWGRSAFDRI